MITMQLVFLGTGSVTDTPKDRTLNTIYLSKDNKGLLLNCTDDIVTQLSKNNISISDINSIIVNDDNFNGLKAIDKMLSESLNVYANKQTLSKLPKFTNLKLNELINDKITTINNFKIIPFEDGVCVDDVLYSNTSVNLSQDSTKYLNKANVLILNSNKHFNADSYSVENVLNLTNKYLPNTVILTNIDTSYPSYEQSLKNITLYWDRIKISDNVNVKLAYDSMVYDTVDLGYVPGIYLNKKTIDYILSGKKDILTRTTCFKDLLDKELVLVDDKKAYGTITFDRPTKCISSELHMLSNYSKIIHDYSTVDIPLLLHKFKFTKFDEPKLTIYNHKSYFQEYIPNLCLTDSLLKDINTYDKTKKSSETLLNDHRMTHMYYSMSQSGTKIKFAKDDLINLHNVISTELKVRNLKHDIINNLDKFALTETEQMFDVVHEFTDKTLIKDVVSLLNSDDGLLQFAFKDLNVDFKELLTNNINSQFNDKLKIELLNTDEVLIDSKVPVYDLVLLKRSPRMIKLKKSKFETFEPFTAPESKKINDLELLIKELW